MHRSTLTVLACPSCHGAYEAVGHQETSEAIQHGFLRCECRTAVIPIVDGFALFTEPLLHEGLADPESLARMSRSWFRTTDDFDQYLGDKRTRSVIEPYAAFHPFIESGRAVEPLLPYLLSGLREASFVLDPWCRTGWSGEWLAGLLPAQRIICVWEGNSSVLGYPGFRHLLGHGRRAPNLDIVFSHPERPLPFRSGAFDFLYSLDALHRFSGYPFAGECLRVTHSEGALVFAHVHLTNSEPVPFFERGCNQLHGRDYRAWLDNIAARGTRRGFVLSEARLFDGPAPAPLTDDSLTTDYNGLIAIVPTQPAMPLVDPAADRVRYVVNPMFRIDIARRQAEVAPRLYDGAVAHFLGRHPVYQARLPKQPIGLDDFAILALFLAASGATRAEICAVTCARREAMLACLESLSRAELLLPATVSAAAHRLQRIHANQYAPGNTGDGLLHLRDSSADALSLDGTMLSANDVAEFMARFAGYLQGRHLSAGNRLLVSKGSQPLLWAAALAAAAAGLDVRITDDDTMSPDPTLWLCDDHGAAHASPVPLGLDGSGGGLLSLLAAVEPDYGTLRLSEGIIELESSLGGVRCPLGPLLSGCCALRNQREGFWPVMEGVDPLRDLLTLLTALADGEPIPNVVSQN